MSDSFWKAAKAIWQHSIELWFDKHPKYAPYLLIAVLIAFLLVVGLPALAKSLDSIAEIKGACAKLFGKVSRLGRYLADVETKEWVRKRRAVAEGLNRNRRSDESDDAKNIPLDATLDSGEWLLWGRFKKPSRIRDVARALIQDNATTVILEGESGQGKSVTLRRVAKSAALQAIRSWNTKLPIPLYVNLREATEPISSPSRQVVENLIRDQMGGYADNPGVDEKGPWLYLFDAFDEIPQVLNGESESAENWVESINLFLAHQERRGVIASRSLVSQKFKDLRRYRISDLSRKRRRQIVKRFGLAPDIERRLLIGLETPAFRDMSKSPQFVRLICEVMSQDEGRFGDSLHELLKCCVNIRLSRRTGDMPPVEALRDVAAVSAYAMYADSGIGGAPTRTRLMETIKALDVALPHYTDFDRCLTALQTLKLGVDGSRSVFEFCHLRFREYFCVRYLSQNPARLDPARLLRESRWREVAVAVLQVDEKSRSVVVAEARSILEGANNELSLLARAQPFRWPSNCLQVLEILQEGFDAAANYDPSGLRALAGDLLLRGFDLGNRADKKRVLDVLGSASSQIVREVLRRTEKENSRWLEESAYRQIARLRDITPDIRNMMLNGLIRRASDGSIEEEWQHIESLPELYRNAAKMLKRILLWDIVAIAAAALVFATVERHAMYDWQLGRANPGKVSFELASCLLPVVGTTSAFVARFFVNKMSGFKTDNAMTSQQINILLGSRLTIGMALASVVVFDTEFIKIPLNKGWAHCVVLGLCTYLLFWQPAVLALIRTVPLPQNRLSWVKAPFDATVLMLEKVQAKVSGLDWRSQLRLVMLGGGLAATCLLSMHMRTPLFVVHIGPGTGKSFALLFLLFNAPLYATVGVGGPRQWLLTSTDLWKLWRRGIKNINSIEELLEAVGALKTSAGRRQFLLRRCRVSEKHRRQVGERLNKCLADESSLLREWGSDTLDAIFQFRERLGVHESAEEDSYVLMKASAVG